MNHSASIFQDLAPAVEYGTAGRVFLFFLLVGVPFLAAIRPDERELLLPSRLALYVSASLGVLILAALTAVLLWVEGISPTRIGLHAPTMSGFLGWTAAATLGTLVMSWAVTRVATRFGVRESRLTYHLMPQNRSERLAFLGVSASAGLCEEFSYHGYLLAGLTAWLGSGWWAALVANLAFGAMHGYQGQAGIVRAGLMGYLLSLPVIMGAGLWPAIAAHFLVNALLGFGLWKWMIPAPEEMSQERP